MSNMYGICKYAIEGGNAAKVYEAVLNSYYYRNFSAYLKMDYREGLLLIEEVWSDYSSLKDYILPFLVGDQFYWLADWSGDGALSTNDKEGKYFNV